MKCDPNVPLLPDGTPDLKAIPETYSPSIWLQEHEEWGMGECGCLLVADHQGGGPALFLCCHHEVVATTYWDRGAGVCVGCGAAAGEMHEHNCGFRR